jgi:predicted RNA-binding Zn-ribbon protein involved in translation (DUF1610 family)
LPAKLRTLKPADFLTKSRRVSFMAIGRLSYRQRLPAESPDYFCTSRYNRAMPPIHPEGEDEKADPVGTLVCPNCRKQIAVPQLANVDLFVCPLCGEHIHMPRRSELRP